MLVVEDDFYLASDAARALRDAGAVVCGPYGDEHAALEALEEVGISAVLLDIDLGLGASFVIAKVLKKREIPFVFITGYDQDVIPDDYDGIPRLQKPIRLHQIVSSMAELLARGKPASG